MRRALLLSALIWITAVIGTASAAPMTGDRLAPFSLSEQGGRSLYAWTPGRVTVITFCAFWCDTWKEQSRRMIRSTRALRGLPVDFLTISVDGRWSERGEGKVAGKLLVDPGGSFCRSIGIGSVPYTLVVGSNGSVRYAAQGITRSAEIEARVRGEIGGKAEQSGGVIYLVFDDFPSGDSDQRLLDILRAADARATFFCIGRNLQSRANLVKRAAAEKHSIQAHSWNHNASDPQLSRCSDAIERLTGARPELYRPPGSDDFERMDGARVTMPVDDPYDYTRPGKAELTRRTLSAAKPGCALILHAGVIDTLDALPSILQSLRRRGYEFGVLPK